MSIEKLVVVGLGELKLSSDPNEVLTCLGLGSCVCVAVYDHVRRAAGMVHIVLPSSTVSPGGSENAKFADVAVPRLLSEMSKLGASEQRVTVKVAGGAHMAKLGTGSGNILKIGERNIESTKALLRTAGVRVAGEDTGGGAGRTVRLYVNTGRVTVSTSGQEPRDL